MFYYLLYINIFTFFIYGYDKQLSVNKKFRISENNLFLLSFLGGFIGSYFGIIFFHHKTKKLKFKIWILICTLLWITILILK